ncbi:PE family protein [Mycobacterium pseudoshottsii]|uniref:PE family protein n=1 Tax=Mycobacterium pseudoshottsii TaxID=265949 RepID=UPI00405568F0
MSFVSVVPEWVAAAATDVAGIGSVVGAANAAAGATTSVTAAAGDEVSVAIAALFGGFGREYQAVCGQWAEFEQRFARALGAGAAGAEAAAVGTLSPLGVIERGVWGAVNGPAVALWGRPLIGDGADGAAGTGQAGGAGGVCCGVTGVMGVRAGWVKAVGRVVRRG